jgi:hypothetical protein
LAKKPHVNMTSSFRNRDQATYSSLSGPLMRLNFFLQKRGAGCCICYVYFISCYLGIYFFSSDCLCQTKPLTQHRTSMCNLHSTWHLISLLSKFKFNNLVGINIVFSYNPNRIFEQHFRA